MTTFNASATSLRAQTKTSRERAQESDGRVRVHHAEDIAADKDCVLSRAELADLGIDRWDIQRELARGRWFALGQQSIAIHRGPLTEAASWRQALHEVGSHAALDGPSALTAAGLCGYAAPVHVSVLHGWQPRRISGVVVKELRDWREADVVGGSVRRVAPALAAVRGTAWAKTDRQAALLLVMTGQQRIARPAEMLEATKRFNACADAPSSKGFSRMSWTACRRWESSTLPGSADGEGCPSRTARSSARAGEAVSISTPTSTSLASSSRSRARITTVC
ncbi:MAG: hypothetical protein ABJA81_11430 [Nocardioidaceae bacterium]